MMKKQLSKSMEYVLLTDSDNIAVFIVQFIIVEILLSIEGRISKVEFGEFTK